MSYEEVSWVEITICTDRKGSKRKRKARVSSVSSVRKSEGLPAMIDKQPNSRVQLSSRSMFLLKETRKEEAEK